jgi:polyketide synthase PksN
MNVDQILNALQAQRLDPEEAAALMDSLENQVEESDTQQLPIAHPPRGKSSSGGPMADASFPPHPLLHENTSNSTEDRFTSTFTGAEFFLADHVIKGARVLPGVAYLEMARAAAQFMANQSEDSIDSAFADNRSITYLRDIVWLRPFVVGNEPASLYIRLHQEKAGETNFEIYSLLNNDDFKLGLGSMTPDMEEEEGGSSRVVHSQGVVLRQEKPELLAVDLAALRSQCGGEILTGADCYQAFQAIGIDYGAAHRGLEKVIGGRDVAGKRFVLAEVMLPSHIADTADEYVLHPCVMDASLQALIGVFHKKALARDTASDEPAVKVALPFAMQEVQIVRPCPSKAVTLIREAAGTTERVPKLDLDICDEMGNICVRIKSYSARVLDGMEEPRTEVALLSPTLQAHPAGPPSQHADWYTEHWVVMAELGTHLTENNLEKEFEGLLSEGIDLPGIHWVSVATGRGDIVQDFNDCAGIVLATVQQILKARQKGKVLVQLLVPARGKGWLLSGLAGLLKSANLENPRLVPQVIGIEATETPSGLLDKLRANSALPADRIIRYQHDTRCVPLFGKIDTA